LRRHAGLLLWLQQRRLIADRGQSTSSLDQLPSDYFHETLGTGMIVHWTRLARVPAEQHQRESLGRSSTGSLAAAQSIQIVTLTPQIPI